MFKKGMLVCKKRGKTKDIPGIVISTRIMSDGERQWNVIKVFYSIDGTIIEGNENTFKEYDYDSLSDKDMILRDAYSNMDSAMELVGKWTNGEEVNVKFKEPLPKPQPKKYFGPEILYEILDDYEMEFYDGACKDDQEEFIKRWMMKLSHEDVDDIVNFITKGEY